MAELDALRRAPDDIDARLVHGDRLQHEGDPRGELISLQHRRRTSDDPSLRTAERELLQAHGDTLVPRAGHVPAPSLWFEWWLGYARRAFVRVEDPAQLPTMLEHPSFALVRELAISVVPSADLDAPDPTPALIEALAHRPPTLERLAISGCPRPAPLPDLPGVTLTWSGPRTLALPGDPDLVTNLVSRSVELARELRTRCVDLVLRSPAAGLLSYLRLTGGGGPIGDIDLGDDSLDALGAMIGATLEPLGDIPLPEIFAALWPWLAPRCCPEAAAPIHGALPDYALAPSLARDALERLCGAGLQPRARALEHAVLAGFGPLVECVQVSPAARDIEHFCCVLIRRGPRLLILANVRR